MEGFVDEQTAFKTKLSGVIKITYLFKSAKASSGCRNGLQLKGYYGSFGGLLGTN